MTLNDAWPAPLSRAFDVIIFDWDGTAVSDRHADAAPLTQMLKLVLQSGVRCGIVTGTNLENIERQCLSRIPASAKRNLLLCANRGSEVFGFSPQGEPVLLRRYEATLKEQKALDEAARLIKDELRALGLQTEIIFDRLNRRKIDLIPTERWNDPKKSEFRELLSAVESRLSAAGISGGIASIIERSHRIADLCGIKSAKITSDIKHVEIGLTDKADSARWLKEHLIDRFRIPPENVVLFGDEFGMIGGAGSIGGSDSLMRIPGLEGASFVSVGVEPGGIPPGVSHMPGGPIRFIEFLRNQAALRNASSLRELIQTQDPTWILEQEGFDPSREGEMEALFTIGNGYLGVRGASDLAIPSSQPDLFLAGVYDRKAPVLPYSEIEFIPTERADNPFCELVPFPSPLPFRIWIADQELRLGVVTLTKHIRRLDMRRGVSCETWEFEDPQGRRTRVSSAELASLSDPHLLLQEIEVTCLNHQALARVDTRLIDPDTTLKYPHLMLSHPKKPGLISEAHRFQTKSSAIVIDIESVTFLDGERVDDPAFLLHPHPGRASVIRKFALVSSSRDLPAAKLSSKLEAYGWYDFVILTRAHMDTWQDVWRIADIQLREDPATTQALRFSLYHLRIAADRDPRVSPGARGLAGRAYEGHVFWDSEIFTLPFYIHTAPDIARSLLQYRYETLDGARKRAKDQGYRGACYAWESTVTGEDVTPVKIALKGTGQEIPIFTGSEQIHVTADIAYGIKRYWSSTQDTEFLSRFGAEILIEAARYWQSRVEEREGRYHLLKVVGPDEYHHGVTNNAYTNWMARFNLKTAIWAVAWIKTNHPDRWAELERKLSFGPSEPAGWENVASRLFIPQPNQDGVIEQFDGFFKLPRSRIDSTELLRPPLARLFAWKETNEQQLIKQADVLMIPFLFPRAFSREILLANYRYYEPVTDHGSSLSPCVHAAIAARLGLWEDADRFWKTALDLDLMNRMRNTALGIHLANMGGVWQSLIFHFLGIEWGESGIGESSGCDVRVPSSAAGIDFKLIDRGETRFFRFLRKEHEWVAAS